MNNSSFAPEVRKNPGRKSANEIALRNQMVSTIKRPSPPDELSDEETVEWNAIVNRCPADWFPRETHPMLLQYCRHTVRARRIAMLIHRFEDTSIVNSITVREYDRLLKMQERESRCITSLATKLRVSQQANYDKTRKKPPIDPEVITPPWND